MPRQNNILIPQARKGLDNLKYVVASELGYGMQINQQYVNPQNYRYILENMKYEFAEELGIAPLISKGSWGNVPSNLCGSVGGRMGGKIGGNMVRRMIQFAEQNISQ